MPLKLVPPRKGRSPNFTIRGTYLGQYVDESTGCARRAKAKGVLRAKEREIERSRQRGVDPRSKTFADAAAEYLKTCSDNDLGRVERALDHFGDTPLPDIDNQAVADYAADRYPPGPDTKRPCPRNATINRECVAPVSVICSVGGLERRFRRYPENKGRVRSDSAEAIEAFLEALPEAVETVRGKYRGNIRYPRSYALFVFMCNTRRTETMLLDWRGDDTTPQLDVSQRQAVFPRTKNADPRIVPLVERLVADLMALPHRTGRVFGYRHTKQINDDWTRAREMVAGDHPSVANLSPHGARHDFAYWRRRFYKYDLKKLMEVGGWRSVNSVIRYAAVPDDEARAGFEESPLAGGKSVESTPPDLQVVEKKA